MFLIIIVFIFAEITMDNNTITLFHLQKMWGDYKLVQERYEKTVEILKTKYVHTLDEDRFVLSLHIYFHLFFAITQNCYGTIA